MSADGNVVVFVHSNTEFAGLEPVSGGHSHVYHKNLTTGQLQVVDIQPDGSLSDMVSGGHGIDVSDDGSIVSFFSTSFGCHRPCSRLGRRESRRKRGPLRSRIFGRAECHFSPSRTSSPEVPCTGS